jgi:hypothetical protein
MNDEQFAAKSRPSKATGSRVLRTALCSTLVSLGAASVTRLAAAGEPFAADSFIAQVLQPQQADHASSDSGDQSGSTDGVSAQQRFVADRVRRPTSYESQAALLRAPRFRKAE